MKRAQTALVLLACASLAACGASSASGGVGAGTGGSSTGSAGTSGAAGTGGLPMCQVDILPIVPASFDHLVAGPAAKMRVRGAPSGPVMALFAWKWAVSLADGTPVPVTTIGTDPSLVEFPLATVGTFTIAVDLMGSSCNGLRTITAAQPGAKVATFRIHVTPPSTATVPAQDLQRQVIGGTPSGGNILTLDNGFIVGFDVARSDDGSELPSYVRLTDVTSGAVLETHTSQGGANLLRVAPGTYTTLIVPDGDIAPISFPARDAADFRPNDFEIDDGTMIAGTVVDASGLPIKGATVVLRGGDQVSTTGTTDATGAFHVRARAGTFGVTVVSPLAAGGLEAKLDAVGGLVVDETAPTPPLAIKMQTGALVTGTVALSGDKANLTTATRATLTTPAKAITNAGTLTVGAGAPRALAGDVRLSLNLAADGTLSTGGVPAGHYTLTVFPASATSLDGVTTATLDLPMSAAPMLVPLAQKVMLTGKLLPAAEAWGVRLVAFDIDGVASVSEGDAAQDGSFMLAVSPFRSYRLRALPRPDQVLARASFPGVVVLGVNPPAEDHDMPPALLYAGRVVDPNLQGVATALVQAYCRASAPGCGDPNVPVAETITRSDGTFQLMLPDPDGTP